MPRKYTMLEVRITREAKQLLAETAQEAGETIADIVAKSLADTFGKPVTFFLPARKPPGRRFHANGHATPAENRPETIANLCETCRRKGNGRDPLPACAVCNQHDGARKPDPPIQPETLPNRPE